MAYPLPLESYFPNMRYAFRWLCELASNMFAARYIDSVVTAASLDSSGKVYVAYGNINNKYKVRGLRLTGGGTSFGAAGNRTIGLTDGTTTWTTIPNATIEAAPATTLGWGDTAIPYLTGTSNTASVAGADIYFAYNGGTTDHGGVGSIVVSVLLEKIA